MVEGEVSPRGWISPPEDIEELYIRRVQTPHNINLHMPLLRYLAKKCETITEFGTDIGFSTTAFLAAKPKVISCYDVKFPEEIFDVLSYRPEGTTVVLSEVNTVGMLPIAPTDLLFIDTKHTYEQVQQELAIHGDSAMKFIVLHDIVSFPEIVPAIREWMATRPEWVVREWSLMQSGMAVLERIDHREDPSCVYEAIEP